MSHISSAYRLLTTCMYVHVRKGAREILGNPVSWFYFPSLITFRLCRQGCFGQWVLRTSFRVQSYEEKNRIAKKITKIILFYCRRFPKIEKGNNSYDILFRYTHPFVTGIVSHFCNCYMLQLCWNHKFRGFQKVSDGFNADAGFKFQVSEVRKNI